MEGVLKSHEMAHLLNTLRLYLERSGKYFFLST